MYEAISKFYIINKEVDLSENYINDVDGVIIYEVLKVINSKPLFYKEHYERMKNSFVLSNSEIAFTEIELKGWIDKLIQINNIEVGNIKISYNLINKDAKVYVVKHRYPTTEMYLDGVDTILCFAERKNPNAKVVDNKFREVINAEIKEKEAFEAILVNDSGYITEGSKSNIFMIKGNILYTSKVDDVLPGVTRSEIIRVAKENNIEVREEEIHYKRLKEFDSIFISGTSPDILPIKLVDDIKFNTSQELLVKLMRVFENNIKSDVK